MEERRRHRRLDLSGELIMKPLGKPGATAESVAIEIFDCSTSGLGFSCERQLMMGDNYEAYLTIWTKEVLHVFLQIVRGKKKGDTFFYGSIFIGMPEIDRQRIAGYETVEELTGEGD